MATTTTKNATRGRASRRAAAQPRGRDGEFKKRNSHWGTVAIVGGVAAVGAAATAALFALRGTSWNDFEDLLIDHGDHAHPNGVSDSATSFDTKITGEGTFPA